MKAGDIIKHNPSGETWTVAAVCNRTKMLLCCGWPESMAPWSDCELKNACDRETHALMLREVAKGNDCRASWARANLEELKAAGKEATDGAH